MTRGCFLIMSHKESTRIAKLNWIKDLPKYDIDYVIVTGDPTLTEPLYDQTDHTVILPCPDDYNGLPYKTKAAFQFVETTFQPSFVFKIDDDIFMDPEKLIQCYKTELSQCDYAGYVIYNTGQIYCGGPLYFVSEKAISVINKTINPTLWQCWEDLCVGECLMKCPEIILKSVHFYTDFLSEKDLHIAYHDRTKIFL